MPSTINRAAVETWKMRFRRKFAGNLAGLAALADQVAQDAHEFVTFTSTSEDGESAAGVITGNKLEILTAAEELLIDPLFAAGLPQRSRTRIPDYTRSSPV